MSAISSWIMCILSLVILSVVLDLLLSGTRMHKLIQTVFATVTVLVIITPIPSLIKNGITKGEIGIFDGSIELDSGYLDYANNTLTLAMERGVSEALRNEGFLNVEVSITADFKEEIIIKEVRINLKNLVIDKNYLHINKYEYVLDKVSGYLKINKDVIIIYD